METKQPKKRGRKPKIKPEEKNTESCESNTPVENTNLPTDTLPEKLPEMNITTDVIPQKKKRGRKPKGGKIIPSSLLNNNIQKEFQYNKQNVILHLRCNSSQLESN